MAGGAFGAAVGLGVQGLIAFNISENGKVFVLTLAGVPWIILAYSMAEMIFVGLTSMQAGSDQDREWFGRSNGWYAAVGIGWLALMSLVVIGPIVVHEIANIDSKTYKTWLTTAAAVIGPLSGIVSAVLGHSSGTPAKSEAAGWTGLSLNIVLAITVPIFLASLIIGLSVGIDWSLLGGWLFDWRRGRVSGAAGSLDWFWLLIGLGITGTIGVFASLCININWFSMHSLYRNRLIRAFLGASHALRRPIRSPVSTRRTIRRWRSSRAAKKGLAAPGRQMAPVPRHQCRAQSRVVETSGMAGAQGGVLHHEPAALRIGP